MEDQDGAGGETDAAVSEPVRAPAAATTPRDPHSIRFVRSLPRVSPGPR